MRRGTGVCCDALLRDAPPFPVSEGVRPRHVSLDPVPSSVGLARRFVSDVLVDLADDRRDVALLLTSELVTNAILHARTPVELSVVVEGDKVLVCVGDRLEVSDALVAHDHSRTRPGGRGLALVADLSSAWGTHAHVGGKTVWFVLPDEAVGPAGTPDSLRAG